MPVGGWDRDLGRDSGRGKCEDQQRMKSKFMALKGVVRKEQVGGHAEPRAKGEKWRMLL